MWDKMVDVIDVSKRIYNFGRRIPAAAVCGRGFLNNVPIKPLCATICIKETINDNNPWTKKRQSAIFTLYQPDSIVFIMKQRKNMLYKYLNMF